jgi:hypothetical protein
MEKSVFLSFFPYNLFTGTLFSVFKILFLA